MDHSTRVLSELAGEGFKAKCVSVAHIPQLKEDIERHVRQGLIDTKILETYMRFRYDYAEILPGATTLFIVAIPQPVTRSHFTVKGKIYEADTPPTYIAREDDARAKNTILRTLEPQGHKIARALLPVKTLAVRSGLARYGRNNITYVDGFGSYHRLVAYYADCPSETDNWHEVEAMRACDKCTACLDNCPTRCIPSDRFLIHAENCLTWHNENAVDFASWIKPEWHNALIGCMRCQTVCPVNKPQLGKIVEGPLFTEEETSQVIRSVPFASLPEETRRKLACVGFSGEESWLARNLKVLITKQ